MREVLELVYLPGQGAELDRDQRAAEEVKATRFERDVRLGRNKTAANTLGKPSATAPPFPFRFRPFSVSATLRRIRY